MRDAKRPTRSQLKHAAILDAAATEFRDSGFAATSMDRIAERANVSKRTVYNHFESKEKLFEAILELLWSRVHEATSLPYDPGQPAANQLRTLARRELELLADNNYLGLARALAAEAIRSPHLLVDKWAELAERGAGLTTWIEAAEKDGQLEVSDPAFAADQLTALLKGRAFWPQVVAHQPPPTPGERDQLVEASVAMFLATYGRTSAVA